MKDCPQCKQRFPDDMSFCYADGSTLEPLADARLGNVILSRYVLETLVGTGRAASVYRSRDRFSSRPVAVKVFGGGTGVAATTLRDPKTKAELVRAAMMTERLVHPNIATIYEAGETEDGEAVVVTELCSGPSIAKLLANGKLPVARALDLAAQIARGLTRALDFAIPHGDLRAENVFVEAGDKVKIVDLGLFRGHEALRGLASLAPDPMVGPFSDLYALGALLFQMLSGSLPFEGTDRDALLAIHKGQPAPRLAERVSGLPAGLDALVAALLGKTPMERPVDAHAVVAALTNIARAEGKELVERSDGEAEKRASAPDLAVVEKRWRDRMSLFNEMLKKGFPSGSPPHVAKAIESISKRVDELGAVRAAAASAVEREEITDQEARESLVRIGEAMSTVMLDASSLRRAVRAQGGAVGADLGAQLADVDYQVKDLRSSMEALLSDTKERKDPLRKEIAELGRRWTTAETELLFDAARFCAPLRARPELVPLFSKLS